MHTEDIVIDYRRKGEAIEHGITSFPHLFAQLISESILRVAEQASGRMYHGERGEMGERLGQGMRYSAGGETPMQLRRERRVGALRGRQNSRDLHGSQPPSPRGLNWFSRWAILATHPMLVPRNRQFPRDRYAARLVKSAYFLSLIY